VGRFSTASSKVPVPSRPQIFRKPVLQGRKNPEPGTGVPGKETNGNPSTLQGTAQPGHKSLRHRFRNNVTGGLSPEVVGVEEFTGVAGVVLPVEMCEESELSELSPLSDAASHRRGYVSSFSNFSDAGGDRAR